MGCMVGWASFLLSLSPFPFCFFLFRFLFLPPFLPFSLVVLLLLLYRLVYGVTSPRLTALRTLSSFTYSSFSLLFRNHSDVK